ncbi:MAG TPA: prepilin-type N-terminal cleavage/methylation domain-containing protein [Gemmatimonadaceae bacterium]|nr:prepilin-type N-terminal cleavage/methylation domain-containing protein [Gemmatimonadaceae bacterium]
MSLHVPRTFAPRSRPGRNGFTLIELLIVVVVIGVLAAIAIPKFQTSKGKAHAAAIKSDLKNLMTAQEAHFYENAVYTSDLNLLNLDASSGVILTIHEANAMGWSASATHPAAFPIECAIYVGAAAQVAPAQTEGLMGCS